VKIVIIGAGAVGADLARKVSARDHDVTVIERDPERLAALGEALDCRLVEGSGVSPATLREVGVAGCDLFAAVTDSDETNIIACLTAARLGAPMKVARVRREEYYEEGRLGIHGIDLAINPDHEAVSQAREALLQTTASEVHQLAGGRVRVAGARVDKQASAAGRSIAEVFAERRGRGVLAIAVVRDGQTHIPRGGTRLHAGDFIYLAGGRAAVERALTLVHAPTRPLHRAMIVGANPRGLELARDLVEFGVHVKLIDRSEEKCRHAAETLRHVLVLHGDGIDLGLLESEGLSDTDGFVSLSSDEETNIMACLLARRHGVNKTVCLVERSDYVPLLPQLGIDTAVSPRLATASRIARLVRRGAMVSAESLGFTDAEILQFRIGPSWRGLGRPLAALEFPPDALLGAIIKGGRVHTPRGDSALEAGDEVLVFTLPQATAAVEAFFAP